MCPFPLLLQRVLPALLLLAICLGFTQPASAVQATDVLGRKVQLDHAPQRIVLGEGRLFFALALLDRDNPFQRVVGWQNDMRLLDPHTYAVYAQQYPQVAKLPLIGQASEQSVSAEQILALKPDLAIFSIAGEGPTQHSPVADLLEKAGVPVLFIDFRVHPIRNTRVSMEALGTHSHKEPCTSKKSGQRPRHLIGTNACPANTGEAGAMHRVAPFAGQARSHNDRIRPYRSVLPVSPATTGRGCWTGAGRSPPALRPGLAGGWH